MTGITHPAGFDGASFASVLKGESQPERTMVFKEHNENSGGQRTPMRAVQTKDFVYSIELFDHRVPEEAYEVRYDPDALSNLIVGTSMKDALQHLQSKPVPVK